jgi:deoxyribose-phosphate aldolase
LLKAARDKFGASTRGIHNSNQNQHLLFSEIDMVIDKNRVLHECREDLEINIEMICEKTANKKLEYEDEKKQ